MNVLLPAFVVTMFLLTAEIGQERIEIDRDGEVGHGANSSLAVAPRSLSVPFGMYDARSSDDDPMG
jgi:hypothetical protein